MPDAHLTIPDIRHDDPNWIALTRTPRVCAFLNRNAILFDLPAMEPHPDHQVIIGKAGAIEQYTLRNGYIAAAMGAFSSLQSPLDWPDLPIGRYCSIGSGLVIFGERHPLEWVTTSDLTYCFSPGHNKPHHLRAHQALMGDRWSPLEIPPNKPSPVIGHDVWIGQNVTIARGLTIGTGAILGTGSVVTRDVAPYTIVGGNPARPIRRRFDDALCARLLASRWWECHPDALFRFDRADPARFLDALDAARAAGTIGANPVRGFTWEDMLREIAAMDA